MFGQKAGSLIRAYFTSLAAPGGMAMRAAFMEILQETIIAHGVSQWQALPPRTLRELELVLVHLVREADLVFTDGWSGLPRDYLVQLQKAGAQDGELAARASKAYRAAVAEREAYEASRVDLNGQDLIAWMADKGPAVWHEVALGYNWDADAARELGWIVDRPDCDLATALYVFLQGSPHDFIFRESLVGLPEYQMDIFHMLDRIAKRVIAGGYSTRNFGMRENRAEEWSRNMDIWRPQHRFQRWDIPDAVFLSLRNEPTNAPYTFHDGDIFRRIVQ